MSEDTVHDDSLPKNQDSLCNGFARTYNSEDLADKERVWQSKSPDLRRRKYSLASMMRILDKKTDEGKETKEEIRERKLQKREPNQNSKPMKRGIFNLRSRQNNNKITEECNENGVCLIPPVPCELGYNDLLIEEVGKPRSSSIIHASENVLLSDVQRQRSQKSPRLKSKQPKSNSEPPSPAVDTRSNHLSPGRFRRAFRSDSGYEDNGERSPKERSSPNSTFDLTNSDLRTMAYSELGRVLQGKMYNSKYVALWSKKITENLLLKVRRLTHNRKKVIANVYMGEKFPGDEARGIY